MVSLSLRKMGRVALDLVYPPRCTVCGRDGAFVCEACLAGLPRADGERCNTCWLPFIDNHCWPCDERHLRLEKLRSVYRYEGDVRRIVHRFKFSGHSSLSEVLGDQLALAYAQHDLAVDVVVPVPLTGHKRRQRGYNQAALLASHVARAHGLTIAPRALQRRGHSQPQAGSSSAALRLRNVEGVFSVARPGLPGPIQGRRVLLVDDVATTGATLSACAAVLLESGAASVSALTLARED